MGIGYEKAKIPIIRMGADHLQLAASLLAHSPGRGYTQCVLTLYEERVQTDIFYSCSTISEKLKVTFRVLSILKRQIFSAEFWKLMGLLKFLNICFCKKEMTAIQYDC